MSSTMPTISIARLGRGRRVEQLLAERIFAGEMTACAIAWLMIDHRRLRGVLVLAEMTAANETRAERGEIAGADLAILHLVVLAVIRPSIDPDPHRVAAGQRRRAVTPTACTPGSTETSSRSGAEARPAARWSSTSPRGRRDRERRQMIRLEADVDVQEPVQALPEQRRTHEQNHRGRKLEDHELRSDASPCITRHTAAAFGQPALHADSERCSIGVTRRARWREARRLC